MSESSSTQHRGFGKLILFGEHFVVYKQPALVAAVGAATTCTVELGNCTEESWSTGLIIEDERPCVPGYKDKKRDEMIESQRLVLKHLGVDTVRMGVKIKLGGDLCCVSGIGASAANCVALTRALASALGKDLTEAEINAGGYEGEKGYHGTPSGIDNTASTYGGVLSFQRTDGDPIFKVKKLTKDCRIVYASSGLTSSTIEVVGDVRAKKDADPAWYDALEKAYVSVFERAETALETGDWAAVGQLANENHALLQNLGVSCKELDVLVDAALGAGAVGAKLAGTGRGGLMWAITPDEATQKSVHDALAKISPQVWSTTFSNS